MALIREASRANRRRSVRGAVRAEEQLKLPSIPNQVNWRAFQGLTKSCSQHQAQSLRYLLAGGDFFSEIHIEVISPRNDLIAVKLNYAHYFGCSDLAAISARTGSVVPSDIRAIFGENFMRIAQVTWPK